MGWLKLTLPMTRLGCHPGDYLFLSGNPGMGNAFALQQLMNDPFLEPYPINYRPTSRICEGKFLRKFATCCMDTSDGVFAALDQLMRLNNVGFGIDLALDCFIHADAITISEAVKIPLWLLLAGHHGEYELAFTIPSLRVDDFLECVQQTCWEPLLIGEVIEDTTIRFLDDNEMVPIDTGQIRNLFMERHGDVEEYIKQLLERDLIGLDNSCIKKNMKPQRPQRFI